MYACPRQTRQQMLGRPLRPRWRGKAVPTADPSDPHRPPSARRGPSQCGDHIRKCLASHLGEIGKGQGRLWQSCRRVTGVIRELHPTGTETRFAFCAHTVNVRQRMSRPSGLIQHLIKIGTRRHYLPLIEGNPPSRVICQQLLSLLPIFSLVSQILRRHFGDQTFGQTRQKPFCHPVYLFLAISPTSASMPTNALMLDISATL